MDLVIRLNSYFMNPETKMRLNSDFTVKLSLYVGQ